MTFNTKATNLVNSYNVKSQYDANAGTWVDLILGGMHFETVYGSKAPKMVLTFYPATDEVIALDKQIRAIYAKNDELYSLIRECKAKIEKLKAAKSIAKKEAEIAELEAKITSNKEVINQLRAEITNNNPVYKNDRFVIALNRPDLTREDINSVLQDKLLAGIKVLASLCGENESAVVEHCVNSVNNTLSAKDDDFALGYIYVRNVLRNIHVDLRDKNVYDVVSLPVQGMKTDRNNKHFAYATVQESDKQHKAYLRSRNISKQ